MSTATATPTRDQAETARAVARLTEAGALLTQTAADMQKLAATGSDVRAAQIADLARRAAESTDMALIVANNEAKLARHAA